MTARKFISLVLAVWMLSVMFTGCSAPAKNESFRENLSESMDFSPQSPEIGSASDKTSEANVADNRKIIVRYSMNVETLAFDEFLPQLQAKIAELGGYVESSNIDNNSRSRYAYFTIRLPKATDVGFTDYLMANSNVTYRETRTEDVTLSYVDMESRLASYEAEKEKLEELLKEAKDLSDVLLIQDRLTQVIYQIESYESQLRTYDNLIDYTTFTLTVREVEKETVTEELSVFETIGKNLSDGFVSVWNFLVQFFIFLISAIPYLLLLAAFGGIGLLIGRACRKLRRKRKAKKEEQQK